MSKRRVLVLGGALVVLLVAAVVMRPWESDDYPEWQTCSTDPLDDYVAPAVTSEGPEVHLETVVDMDGLSGFTTRPGDDRFVLGSLSGKVLAVAPDGSSETLIDISDQVDATEAEQGLFDVEFSADGEHLYVSYSQFPELIMTVDEWTMDGDQVDPDSRRNLIEIQKEKRNHNGGDLEAQPDGLLFISLGDGSFPRGGTGGPAQRLDTLLGKIIRIDPTPSGDLPYTIPDDNPYVDDPDARGEIWSFGVRNPWRITVDDETGDLWIGDVGERCWEEVDHVAGSEGGGAGIDFGYMYDEGGHEFIGDAQGDEVPPVYEFPHAQGFCSVIGGKVYRGDAVPELQGSYLFSDLCRADLQALTPVDGGGYEWRALGIAAPGIIGFGQDVDGEVYVLASEGVQQLVAGPPPPEAAEATDQ